MITKKWTNVTASPLLTSCLVSSKYAVYKKLIVRELLFLHIFDACKAFSLSLNTATSFQNSLDTFSVLFFNFPNLPKLSFGSNRSLTCFTLQIKPKAKNRRWTSTSHIFNFVIFSPVPFHSETAASFQCSSDKHWGILQHHLGARQPTGLSHIQGAHNRKQRLVKGNECARTPKQNLKMGLRGRCSKLPPSVSLLFTPSWQDPVHSISLEEKHFLLDQKKLQPHVGYTVDVKAKMCPGNIYQGPWSEWSSTAETSEIEGRRALYRPAWNQNLINIRCQSKMLQYLCCGFMLQTVIRVSVSILHSNFPETGSVNFVQSCNFFQYIIYPLCRLYRI